MLLLLLDSLYRLFLRSGMEFELASCVSFLKHDIKLIPSKAIRNRFLTAKILGLQIQLIQSSEQ